MTLFINKPFTSHSGEKLDFKIECDSLTDEDIKTLSILIAKNFEFSEVIGIPSGGERLAKELEKYKKKYGLILIVDDVLTTGKSMKEMSDKLYSEGKRNITGVVIFARGPCPWWVTPIFQMVDIL